MQGWLTTNEVAALMGMPPEEDVLELLNVTAIAQLEAFAPPLAGVEASGFGILPFGEGPFGGDGASVPTSWHLAQVMQVRSLYNASKATTSGAIGDGDFAFTPKPLDWQVKAILRPKRGRPLVG